MRILFILLLVSFAANAQRPVKKPHPGKVVQVSVNITPAAPTTPVVNDVLDTYSVTLSSGYGTTEHEYTLNGGSSTTTLTSLPVSVGDVAKAIGQVGIRVKAATGRNASAWLFNTTAFTVASLTQLSTPSPLVMAAAGTTAMDFSYANVANETGYSVQIATNSGFTTGVQTVSKGINVTTHQFTGLSAGTTYYGRVLATANETTYTASAYATDNESTDASGITFTDVNITSYGVSAANSASANDAALATMKAALAGTTAYRVTINGAANGALIYNNNDFFNGIRYLEVVNGGSTSWQSVSTDPNEYKTRPFSFTGPLQTVPATSFEQGISVTTSAAIGATKIYLASLTGVSTGVRGLISGFEKQFAGIPDNPEFTDWFTVTSTGTDGGGSYANITPALTNAYNTNWKDFTNYAGEGITVGKPRVWLDDKGSHHTAEYVKFIGGTIKPSSVSGSGALLIPSYVLELENTVLNPGMSIWPSYQQRATYTNVTAPDMEIDKKVKLVQLIGGTYGTISGATGNDRLEITGATTGYTNVSPKEFVATNHTIDLGTASDPCIYPQPQGMSSRVFSFEDCNYNSDNTDGLVDIGHIQSFTIDGTNITTNGTDILIPDNSTYNWIVTGMLKGLQLWKSDGSKFATETDVEWNGTKYVLKTTGATFTTGEQWQYSRTHYVQDFGGNVSGNPGVPFLHGNVARWKGNTGGPTGVRSVVWNQNDVKFAGNRLHNALIIGHVGIITVTVTTPKSGASINIYKNGYSGDNSTLMGIINLNTAGTRTFTTSGFTPLSGDTGPTVNLPSGYLSHLSFLTSGGSTSDLPQFTITLNNFYPYQNSSVTP